MVKSKTALRSENHKKKLNVPLKESFERVKDSPCRSTMVDEENQIFYIVFENDSKNRIKA